MASAHKKIWTKTVDGVTVRRETAKYYAHYVDHLGKHRAVPGYEDKRRTERLAWRLEEEAEALRRGERPTMSVLSGEPVSALITKYGEFLAAADRSDKHCNMVLSQLRKMYNDLARPQDLTREAVAGVMLAMKEAGSSAQTRKHYLTTTKAFVGWMVKAKAIPHHFLVDIAALPSPNVGRGRRHRRRTVPTVPVPESLCAMYPFLSDLRIVECASFIAAPIAFNDSAFAESRNPHVFTITRSAPSARVWFSPSAFSWTWISS